MDFHKLYRGQLDRYEHSSQAMEETIPGNFHELSPIEHGGEGQVRRRERRTPRRPLPPPPARLRELTGTDRPRGVQETLAVCWANLGAADDLALDVLLNALQGFSTEYVSIKAVQVGGSEFRGWRKERPETSMLTPPNIPGMPPDETLGGGPGAGDPMRMVDLEELSKQIREDLRDHE